MNMKTTYFRTARHAALLSLIMLGLILGGHASAATMPDLLKMMPMDSHFAVGLPDIAEVERVGAPLFQLPPFSRITDLGVMLGGDTLSEGLENSGINAAAPGAVFLSVGPANNMAFSGVLVVSDADKVQETLQSLLGSAGTELELADGITGRFIDNDDVGYFIHDNKLGVASTTVLLEQLAARIALPAPIAYGMDGVKDEVVIWSQINTIEETGLLERVEPLAYIKPLLATVKQFSDEVIFAIGEDAGQAYLRLAARDVSGEALLSPGPLTLHGFMDTEAPVVLNLRLTPELLNVASMTLSQNPSTRQAGGYIRIASALLGDEMAVSFKGMQSSDVPDAVIAAKVKQAASVPGLLRLAKLDEPAYQHEDKDVYVYENIADDTDLHIGVIEETLIITPGEGALKNALSSFVHPTEGATVPSALSNRGVHGFLMLDGSKAKDLPPGLVPANVNLDNVNIAVTLGLDQAWRELVVTSPAGFSGIAEMLKNLM